MNIFGFYFLYILGGAIIAVLAIEILGRPYRQNKLKEEKIDDSDPT